MAKEKQIIKYDLTFETLGGVSQELEAYLKEHNTDAKDIQTALLLLEEISVRFLEQSPETPVQVRVRNRFGSISVTLSNAAEDAAMQPEEPDAQPDSGEKAPAGNAEEVGAGV